MPHFVDQAETSGAELDFGAITGAPQLAGWSPRFDQPFGQLLFALLPDPCAQGPSFPQGLGMKGQLRTAAWLRFRTWIRRSTAACDPDGSTTVTQAMKRLSLDKDSFL
jgi:hypothetical protein